MALLSVLVTSAAWATETKTAQPPPQTVQPPAQAVQPPPQKEAEGVIDPRADAALRRMSNYITGLKSFRVEAVTTDEKFTTDGAKIQEIQHSKVVVKRPGQLRVDRVGPSGHATFRDDGKQFIVYNRDKNVYAVAPAPPTLDAAIDDARDRLRIDAPGGDLLTSDPYGTLTEGLRLGRYIGLEPIDGVKAHHIDIIKKDVDVQLWIQDGPEAVPLRYIVTSKDMPGQPEFTIELRHWQPNVLVTRSSFALAVPIGAKRVELPAPSGQQR
jgi:hypothetical protein